MTTQTFSWQTPDNLRIHAQKWTVQHPQAVLCIVHGLGEHLGRYTHVAEFFTQQNINVWAFDQRGHGRSEGKRGFSPNYELMLDEIARFLAQARAENPDTPLFLYGHSMGGNLVLQYTLDRQPELNGLIASAPLILPGFEPPKLLLQLARLSRSVYPQFTQPNGIEQKYLCRDKSVIEAYDNDPLVHDKISASLAVDSLDVGRQLNNFQGTLPVPTLIMHGSADQITDSVATAAFAKRVNGEVTFKNWEGFYHELHNEPEQAEVLQYTLNWIQSLFQ